MTGKYTVVLTSYNAQDTISRAINSFLTQSIIPLEIIVVDDASTDNTWSILQDLAKMESSLIIFQNDSNRGQSFSRNLGVERSKSNYIIFGDDDDKSLPGRASLHLKQLERGSEVGYVSSRKIYRNGYSTLALNSQIESCSIDPLILVRKLILGQDFPYGEIFVPSCALAVSKDTFMKVGGFDENFRRLEDVDLAIRFARNGNVFDWSSELALERHHSEGTDKGGAIDPFFEISLINKYSEYLNQSELENATISAKLRSAYFSHQYIVMLRILLSHKGSFTLSRNRFFSFIRRLKHDLRKS
jgi:glycosyltransferase involved in cell wall biosynthesis